MAETIIRAAIRLGAVDYSVPRPGRHGDVMRVHPKTQKCAPEDQGFLTSTGRFVQRDEAREIAEAARQLLPNTLPHSELFSEDVW